MSAHPPAEFAGNERFVVRRRLGEGGMGVVYEAYDRERDAFVALKTLSRIDASSIYRLKREFRALADLSHPNLVHYHELVSAGDRWFFTMELVDGVEFSTYVAGAGAGASPRSGVALSPAFGVAGFTPSGAGGSPSPERIVASALAASVGAGAASHALTVAAGAGRSTSNEPTQLAIERPAAPPAGGAAGSWRPAAMPFDPARTLTWWSRGADQKDPRPHADLGRLRAALRQLVEGIAALHAAGTLHRDVKPSNVMVTRSGRVVLLDFGLASGDKGALDADDARYLIGTPAYMAPEQAMGEPASPASDWYGVGVMVYEALVGTVPFAGNPREVLMAKQVVEPPRPSTLVDGVDPELDALCGELLAKAPAQRPGAPEILRRLGAAGGKTRAGASRSLPFIGRGEHLGSLHAAFEATRRGHAVAVMIQGVSGMGKSALTRRFLDELARHHDALVLAGRCYERESVPYKALDTLVDALSRYLMRLPDPDAAALLPPNVRALARLFPVLLEVRAVADAPREQADVPDPQELRRRGFGALRELLSRLAKKRPLVLHIDDLQWGDADSAALLADLLRPPSPPALLLLASFRSEEAAASPILRELCAPESPLRAGLDVRDVLVGALAPAHGQELALALLKNKDADAPSLAAEIAREAEGSPFFIAELVRYLEAEAAEHRATPTRGMRLLKLDKVIGARIARLPEDARRLLEIVAVAGRPIAQGVALKAAALGNDAGNVVASLRAEQLLRTRGARHSDEAEAYHDRIREAVVAGLGGEPLRACHQKLGEVLEAAGADPEVLAVHFRGAGDVPRARRYAVRAAEKAAQALAFDRAARLYQGALDLCDPGDPGRRPLQRSLGDALADAGRSAEAARVYRDAARGAPADAALELRRLSAEHACRSGHVDEGLAAFREVTAAVGMRMARSPLEALASLLVRRAEVRLRGLRFRERSAAEVPPELLTRLDVCWSVSVGLGMVDPIQGADFQARLMLLALEAGEPFRLSRALAIEACYASTAGEDAAPRTRALIDAAERLARRVNNPHALATVDSARAFEDIFVGRWRAGLANAERAEAMLLERCTGVAYEIATAQIFGLWALFNLGQIPELRRRYPAQLRQAEERGDLFAASSKRTLVGHACYLVEDDVPGAEREVAEAMRGWSQRGFHVQHWYELLARTNIAMYRGDGELAYHHITTRWPEVKRSLLMRIVSIRNDILFLRGRAALAAAIARRRREPLLEAVAEDARGIAKARLANSEGWSRLLLGGVAHQRGRRDEAIAHLGRAAAAFDHSEMSLWGIMARRREGEVRGGAEGEAMIEAADALMMRLEIRRPDRFTDMLAPGFVER